MVKAGYFLGDGGDCQIVSPRAGKHTMDTDYQSTQRPSSPYHDVNGQIQQWGNPKCLSEVSHVTPQKIFTQVTIAAYQRQNSCHGDLGITYHKSDTEEQRRDLTRSSICNEQPRGIRYKSLRARSYYNETESINTIDQTHCPPPMLCTTSSYLSRPHLSKPDWTGYSFAHQNYLPDDGGACFSPGDCSSLNVAVGPPPTPAETIRAEDFPPKNSLNNSGAPVTSPEYKLEAGSYEVSLGIDVTIPRTAETAAQEQQENKPLLTPPPEPVACSAGRITQKIDEASQTPFAEVEHEACQNAEMEGHGKIYPDPYTALVVGEDSDLDFLSSDWDAHNFEFLDDENGFAPTFMSDEEASWDTRHIDLPSAYPALAPDSGYSTDTGIGLASFQAHSTFAPERPLEYQFDQFGGYLQAQSNLSGLDTFDTSFPTFDTQPFSVHPATSQANDRTSNRSKSKDQMLVDLKQRGYSYKDIKAMGQFEEAESTLRGRYRTLTKPKEARVRKPEWGDREVHLLMQAVTARTNASNDHQPFTTRSASTTSRRANKIPWKQVAEYMALKGSYKYGNATVKKKWMEIMRER